MFIHHAEHTVIKLSGLLLQTAAIKWSPKLSLTIIWCFCFVFFYPPSAWRAIKACFISSATLICGRNGTIKTKGRSCNQTGRQPVDRPAGQREQRNWGGNISLGAVCSSHLSHGSANLTAKNWKRWGGGANISLVQFPVTAYHLSISQFPSWFGWMACSFHKSSACRCDMVKNTSSPSHLSDNNQRHAGSLLKAWGGRAPKGWGSHLLFRVCWHRHTDGERWGICFLQQSGLKSSKGMFNKGYKEGKAPL